MLQRLSHTCRGYLVHGLAILLGIHLFLLVFLELLNVLLRSSFDVGLIWHADVASILLPSLGWFGATYLWLTYDHIDVDVFNGTFETLKPRVQIVSDILMLSGLCWFLPKVFTTVVEYNVLSMPVLPLPASAVYLPPFVALCLMLIATLINILDTLSRHFSQNQP